MSDHAPWSDSFTFQFSPEPRSPEPPDPFAREPRPFTSDDAYAVAFAVLLGVAVAAVGGWLGGRAVTRRLI